ncbi:RlmE family RNA methyltransferase [Holospora undulata]|uniref:Ribosomal RNA large subunit methyltransferase E n=1 Tax=Holospora undulata HU1 TaxID=1321371 RepID=A0A061JG04_9PROT|nr:RlmE family RNA methyltransferase [Holospora undulata]ETZ04705.1 ribosomal RNA large subunit methyltransferase E [Holospora undulata HU1]
MKNVKKKTKDSSRRWLFRQLNDPYIKQAKVSGYRSRSAFKLKEMQEKENIISKGSRILDLGCAPGGWSQVLTEITGVCVWGVDLMDTQPLSNFSFFKGDFFTPIVNAWIQEQGPFCGVVSDAAPPSTGHHATDLVRIEHMVEMVWEIAYPVLRPGGFFLVKAFHTQGVQKLYTYWKKKFEEVKYLKPRASRKESKEIYILGKGYSHSLD